MAAPRPIADAVMEDVPQSGECVLLDPQRGKVLALNASGAAVWDLLDGQREVDELAGILAEAAGIEPEQAEREVRALLERLRAEGFLA